ncbi:MAG: hypothetical protein ACRENS_09080 [Candidatus Eiseniibacteriota bacterium]
MKVTERFPAAAADNVRMNASGWIRIALAVLALVPALTPRTCAAGGAVASPWTAESRAGRALDLRLPLARVSYAPSADEAEVASGAKHEGFPLERANGWTVAGFPLGQTSFGVYLEVRGRSELGRIEVLYDDGTIERVEALQGRIYGQGIYQLAKFDAARRVALVRMKARAASSHARVNVLLAREPF